MSKQGPAKRNSGRGSAHPPTTLPLKLSWARSLPNPSLTAGLIFLTFFSLPKALEWLLTAERLHLYSLAWSMRLPNLAWSLLWLPARLHLPHPHPRPVLLTLILILFSSPGQADLLSPSCPFGTHLSHSLFIPCHTHLISSANTSPGHMFLGQYPSARFSSLASEPLLWSLTWPSHVQPLPLAFLYQSSSMQ